MSTSRSPPSSPGGQANDYQARSRVPRKRKANEAESFGLSTHITHSFAPENYSDLNHGIHDLTHEDLSPERALRDIHTTIVTSKCHRMRNGILAISSTNPVLPRGECAC